MDQNITVEKGPGPGEKTQVMPHRACYVRVVDKTSGMGCEFGVVDGQGFTLIGGTGSFEVTLLDADKEPVVTRAPAPDGASH